MLTCSFEHMRPKHRPTAQGNMSFYLFTYFFIHWENVNYKDTFIQQPSRRTYSNNTNSTSYRFLPSKQRQAVQEAKITSSCEFKWLKTDYSNRIPPPTQCDNNGKTTSICCCRVVLQDSRLYTPSVLSCDNWWIPFCGCCCYVNWPFDIWPRHSWWPWDLQGQQWTIKGQIDSIQISYFS